MKKGKFTNEQHRLRVNLLYSAAWFSDRMNEFLKGYDITQQQFNVLRILRGQSPEPISTKELRERMIVSHADTSRLVDRLCAKDLIWKQPCPHDGRLIQVFIGKKGIELLAEIDKAIPRLDQEFENLSEKEMQILNQLLNKMRFRMDNSQ
ncbi:MAG TPA: MarR family transcriptional regulator [Roseivirga sp.]